MGSGNHFGVTWESRREEWGMLLPFLYLTYILRTCNEHDEDPNHCRVVDILSDILSGVEDEEEVEEGQGEGEREEKREKTEEQKNRNDNEGG